MTYEVGVLMLQGGTECREKGLEEVRWKRPMNALTSTPKRQAAWRSEALNSFRLL